MKSSSLVVRYVSGVVVVVFAVGILATGDEFKTSWLRFFSIAVLVASAGLLLWDQYLWRIPWVQRISKVPRNIRGTWQGELASHWVKPDSGQRIDSKPAYLVVRQTASTLSTVLLTDESKSRSTSAVLSSADGQWSLAYMYLNRPDIAVEYRSRMHHGSTLLELAGSPTARLRGRYWTDRDTKGELSFQVRSAKVADDYEGARVLFPESGDPRSS